MVRRSPTAFEGGYMFYHNIAKNILLVFQLGEELGIFAHMDEGAQVGELGDDSES